MTIKWMNGMSVMENMPKDEILLEGELELFPNEKSVYKVELRRSGITYTPLNVNNPQKLSKYLHFGNIIGCRCRRSSEQTHASKAYFTIFAYPLRKKLLSGKWSRRPDHITFGRSCDNSFDENRKVVEQWRRVIIHIAHNLTIHKEGTLSECQAVWTQIRNNILSFLIWVQTVCKSYQGTAKVAVSNERDIAKCPPPPKTKLLVLVNPYSGPGKAMQIYKKSVAPMLDEADIHVKVIQTEHAGHASEMMKTINRNEWYGVVIVSGDGLIYEVINGLMSRPDWQDAMKLPVGCIPGGSGNALSCAINYSAGESIEIEAALHSTFILIKHKIVPMDLVLIEQPKMRVFSFLSVTWGLLADIDYESEKFRAIGEARFTLQAIRRIMALRKYRAKLSFLPIKKYIPKSSNNNGSSNSLDIPGSRNRRVSLHSLDDVVANEGDLDEDVKLRTKSMPSELYRAQSLSTNLNENTGVNGEDLSDIRDSSLALTDSQNRESSGESPMSLDSDPSGHDQDGGNAVQFSLNSANGEECVNKRLAHLNKGFSASEDSLQEIVRLVKKPGQAVPSNLLQPLDKPVPEDWVTIEDDFVTVCAAYQTHLGSDIIMAPDAHFNDGLIQLTVIRSGITKQQLFSLMTALEKGNHIDNPCPNIELVKVLAFRLEPDLNREGVIMVDGEKVEYAPLQGQVLPGIANLMAIQ